MISDRLRTTHQIVYGGLVRLRHFIIIHLSAGAGSEDTFRSGKRLGQKKRERRQMWLDLRREHSFCEPGRWLALMREDKLSQLLKPASGCE